MYKMIGYISEDESFDSSFHLNLKRRRYSIRELADEGFIVPDDKDYLKELQKRDALIQINYDQKPEPEKSKLIFWSRKWVR